MSTNEVWEALKDAPWERLSRIHGNCHSSMIGLITGWWVGLCPDHYVLDGAPGYISRENADAILCNATGPVGVMEVENTLFRTKAETIGHYLTPDDCHKALRGIHLGVLLMYPVEVTRRQGETDLLSGDVVAVNEGLESVREITKGRPGTEMLVVAVDKIYEVHVPAVRELSGYHHCRVRRVRALRFVGGGEVPEPVTLWALPAT